jgi:hypothetical protein
MTPLLRWAYTLQIAGGILAITGWTAESIAKRKAKQQQAVAWHEASSNGAERQTEPSGAHGN